MPGSTRKEIRQAYARLAKEYHPEEHPKEFNQIQEAYQLLTGRGDGENWSSDTGDDWFSEGEKTESGRESEGKFESDMQWEEESEESEEASDSDSEEDEITEEGTENIQENENSESPGQEDFRREREKTKAYQDISHWESRFDAFEEQERREQWKREAETQRRRMDWQKEQEKLQEQTRRAIRDSLYELELILGDKKKRNRTELYEPFFFRRENRAVMLQEAYVSGIISLLEQYPVKKKVYLTLQKIYSGLGAQSAKVLIRYLEQKNKKETPNVWGAAAFAAIGIGQLQGVCGEEWKSSPLTMLVLIVVILGLGILYAGLRTHYSVGISQIWIAGILFWLSFFGVATTVSDNLFSDADTGIFLAVMVWFESMIWMVILGIRAIILKIRNRKKGR